MHACMQNFELAVLTLYVSVRTGAGYNKPACCVLGTFYSNYLYMNNLLYFLETFCEIHEKFEFLRVNRLIEPKTFPT